MESQSKPGDTPRENTLAENARERDKRFGDAVKKRLENIKKRRNVNETLKKEKS